MSAAYDGRLVPVPNGTKAAFLHELLKLSDETIEATLQMSNRIFNGLQITSERGTSARMTLGRTYGGRIDAKSVIIHYLNTSSNAGSAIFRLAIDVEGTGSEDIGRHLWSWLRKSSQSGRGRTVRASSCVGSSLLISQWRATLEALDRKYA